MSTSESESIAGATGTRAPEAPTAAGGGWQFRLRQGAAVTATELPRCLGGWRGAALYVLAAAPVGLMLLAVVASAVGSVRPSLVEAETAFGTAYSVFILRWCVFFACVAVFMSLFRSDFIDRTLHYWLLAPVRRDVLVAGKYAAGLLAAGAVLSASTAISATLVYAPFGGDLALERLVGGGGLALVSRYVLVTMLACVGYGAIFLLIGIWFRNPIVPALLVLAWEYVNFLLPPALRALSVTYYLQSLLPMPLTEGPLGVVAEPAPAWLAVTGLLAFSAVLLVASAWRLRRTEIVYGEE